MYVSTLQDANSIPISSHKLSMVCLLYITAASVFQSNSCRVGSLPSGLLQQHVYWSHDLSSVNPEYVYGGATHRLASPHRPH
jgi:hypothetical protein